MEKIITEILTDLRELAAIPGVKAAPLPGAPFGAEIGRSLDWFLKKGAEYGLIAVNCDGYAGHLELPPLESDGAVAGVLVHLDVVPADNKGWPSPPYGAEITDGKVFGRGVVDDKGPAVILMHVLKNLREKGVRLKNTVRLIVGGDEESGGSECVKHYFKKHPMPDFGFSPDADFPLIIEEKHIVRLHISLPSAAADRVKIEGNFVVNIVPEYAAFQMTTDKGQMTNKGREQRAESRGEGQITNIVGAALCPRPSLRAEQKEAWQSMPNDNNIPTTYHLPPATCQKTEFFGSAAHSMECFKGDNALWKLCAELNKQFPDDPALKFIAEKICGETDGKKLGIAFIDGGGESLTCNFSVLKAEEGCFKLTLDVRCPTVKRPEEIVETVHALLPPGGELKPVIDKGFALAKDDPLIGILLNAYSSVTNDGSKPKVSGGGTYARHLKRAVAFGPMFPGYDYKLHASGENLPVEQIGKLYEIYYKAVEGMGQMTNDKGQKLL